MVNLLKKVIDWWSLLRIWRYVNKVNREIHRASDYRAKIIISQLRWNACQIEDEDAKTGLLNIIRDIEKVRFKDNGTDNLSTVE